MPQTAQLTTARAVDDVGSLDRDATIEDLVKNMDETVGAVLAQGRDVATTRARYPQMEAADLSPLTGSEQSDPQLAKVVELLPPRPPQNPSPTLYAIQEWEGYVTEIRDEDITANLLDVTAGAAYAGEEAVIPLEELSETDVAKLQLGSVFRWVIGYSRSVVGTKERVSRIVFRDLPAFTKKDVQEAEEWARKTRAVFDE